MPLFLNRGSSPLPVSSGREPLADEEAKFSGGLNTVSADDALGPDQFRRGDNLRMTPFGAVVKRGGSQRTAAALVAATTVQNGAPWYQASGAVVTMAVCNGTLFTTTYGSFPLTWTQRGSSGALSASVTPSFASFLNAGGTESVYIADGGLLNRYTGTTLTTNIVTTPSCNVLAVHNQRLWGCGDPSFPDSIFYSDLNNGDSLGIGASSGGQIVVRTFGDQNVVGLISLGTSLMIFHTTGVSRLTGYGQSDITVTPAGITGDVGSISPFSIARVDNLVYFISDRGLYAASEQSVQPVHTPAKPDPLTLVLPAMSSANIANIRSVYNRATREIEIHIPGVGMYLYHTVLGAWAGPWVDGYLTPETSCLFETHNADGYPIILRGDSTGFVSETDRPNVTLDNVASDGTGGTVYTSTLQSRRLYCTDPEVAKSWRFVYLLAALNGSNSTTITTNTDTVADSHQLPPSSSGVWGIAGSTWGTGTWGSVNQSSYRQSMAGQGYFVDVIITDSGQALPVFSQIRVQGFLLGRR